MDIKDKIRKLLALAGNNPNENERFQAMEMAQKLLAEHDLNMSDVDRVEFNHANGKHASSIRSEKWMTYTALAAAYLYGCKVVIDGNRVVFVGTEEHAAGVHGWT